MELTREHVIWAYRLLLDRDPEAEAAVDAKMRAFGSVAEFRNEMMDSEEFRMKSNPLALFEAGRPIIVIAEIRPGLRIFVDLSDREIGQHIVMGSYELNEQKFVGSAVAPGDAVVDAGSNIGFFSLLLADLVGPSGSVTAFEPLERNAGLLERSLQENDLRGRVKIERAAVGDINGDLELISPIQSSNWGGAYLHLADRPIPERHEARVVPVLRLDDYPFERPIRFIKMDIEGAEALALRGGKRLLTKDRPTILAELNQSQLVTVSRVSATQLIHEMGGLGYDCHPVETEGLAAPIKAYEGDTIINVAFQPR